MQILRGVYPEPFDFAQDRLRRRAQDDRKLTRKGTGTVATRLSAGRKNRETEVKLRIGTARAMRASLAPLGFTQIHARAFEDNVLYDTPDRVLRRTRCLIRIRRYGRDWTLTYKGTPDPDRHFKSRLELESSLDNPEAMQGILKSLGMVPVFRYQKYRTEYAISGARGKIRLEVALDETPVGNFVELEGSRREIDRIARQLGFRRSDYITASYGALYMEACAGQRQPATDMVFKRRAAR
jgi:adenylate cyclase, class 2